MSDATSNPASVTIFGGGIAGLTAAHELAERGFRVLVVEPNLRDEESKIGLRAFAVSPGAAPDDPAWESRQGLGGPMLIPATARHLLDSMRRIPVASSSADSKRAVRDNLVPGQLRAVSGGSAQPFLLLPRAEASATDIYQQLRQLLGSSFGVLDAQMLFLRALRYLTSSPERREKECRTASLSDYLCGRDAQSGLPAFRFSEPALLRVGRETRLVTAVDADYSDARSALNALVQLHIGSLSNATDGGILNGSIEDAWLSHWRTQLKSLGVHFRTGSLVALHAAPQQGVKAEVDWYDGLPPPDWFPSDYQIVATDVVTAERSARSLRAEVGVPDELQGYTTVLSGDPRKPGGARHVGRDPTAIREIGVKAWDRLRLAPWVDFCLPETVPALHGQVYLPDSPWGLECSSSPVLEQISQPNGARVPVAVVRVTLRSFGALPEHDPHVTHLTSESLAREIWEQLERSLTPAEGSSSQLPRPIAYRLDERLGGAAGVISTYRAPQVSPIAADWVRRPSGEPTSPGATSSPLPSAPSEPWSRGGYPVHYGSLLFAGAYLRTFTGLGDAESANESARHAVNALLAHRAESLASVPTNSGSAPAEPVTPDYCKVWNPEECEPLALVPAKELDQRLLAQGLPHLWDLLGVELLPRLASQRAQTAEDPLLGLLAVLHGLAATTKAAPNNSGSILDVLKTIRRHLEQHAPNGPRDGVEPSPATH